jgi:hypothetical protein
MKLDLLLNIPPQRWYISHKFSLTHENHHELPPEANQFESNDLNEDESSWMKHMYNMGLSNGTIAGILNGFLHSKGKKGSFQSTDAKNMTDQYSKELDLLSRNSQDMTQAERTINELNK